MGEISKHDEPIIPEPNFSKREHLIEGFRPIMACVGTAEQYGGEIAKLNDIEDIGHNVDFYGNPPDLTEQGFKNAGHQSYVISSIDNRPKFTKKLADCTSLIAVGREKGAEEELSFLTHQDPDKFLWFKRPLFVQHLKEQLEALKGKCSEGSIDVVIAGGNLSEEGAEYQISLELLTSVVKETCGFEPLVICGPKEEYNVDDVYFDTQKRRAYMLRPKQDVSPSYNDVFKPGEIGKMKEKWKEEKRQRGKREEYK